LIDWCDKHEDIPLVEAFLVAVHLPNMLGHIGASERLIVSAEKIRDKLEPRVRALKG